MSSYIRRPFPLALLLQLGLELCWLIAAVLLALWFADSVAMPIVGAYSLAFVFALLIVALNGAFGLYRSVENLSFRDYALRVVLAPAIGIPFAYLVAEVLPGGESFRQNVGAVVLFSLGGLLLVRHAIVIPIVRSIMPHRVLVLGTGPEARLVEASLGNGASMGVNLAGCYPLPGEERILVASNRLVAAGRPLEDIVRQLGIDEIIVAVRQRRGSGLPLQSLLHCRLNGVLVTDLAGFFERVHGRIPIELVDLSWLVYGTGYHRGWWRAMTKRTCDVVVAALLLILSLPLMAIVAATIVLESGMPIIYRQTRVGYGGRNFTVLKFRSMVRDAETGNGAQWADIDDPRVTRLGRIMRKSRIDELPQLVNVLRGEMSIVGPRPERPEFVATLVEQHSLYAVRHTVKPGITGWAQVRYSYGATVEQSMRKLEYDLYYVKNHSFALDAQILLETIRVVLLGEGGR